MDNMQSPMPPATPGTPPTPPAKKGLGTGAKIGIGCGAVIVLLIILAIVAFMKYGSVIRDFAEEAQTNPTRAQATLTVNASAGTFEMVAEDDVNKRYTLRNTNTGELTTIYWDEAKKAPATVRGDFSAIPGSETDPEPAPEPAPAEE